MNVRALGRFQLDNRVVQADELITVSAVVGDRLVALGLAYVDEPYTPLSNPAAEELREWYHRALDASAARCTEHRDSFQHDKASRQVFSACLTHRIDQLLRSVPGSKHRVRTS